MPEVQIHHASNLCKHGEIPVKYSHVITLIMMPLKSYYTSLNPTNPTLGFSNLLNRISGRCSLFRIALLRFVAAGQLCHMDHQFGNEL